MYPFILCFSCGRCLGDVYDLFVELRREYFQQLLAKVEKTDEKMAAVFRDADHFDLFMRNHDADLSPIFERLKIDRMCCRSGLMSQARMSEYLAQ